MVYDNASSRCVCIDFDRMASQYPPNIRRTCCLPPGQTEDMVWYFRDDHLWQEYGCQVSKVPLDDESPSADKHLSLLALQSSRTFPSSVSSKDIELQFLQNPQGSISFTVGSTGYTLNFASAWRLHRLYRGSPTEIRDKTKKIKAKFCCGKSDWCYFTWQAWVKPTLPQAWPEMFAGGLNFKQGGETTTGPSLH